MAESPLSARIEHCGAWTGSEFIVWGGRSKEKFDSEGAAYDPGRDQWRKIAKAPLMERGSAQAIWTGDRLVVWGGWRRTALILRPHEYYRDGALYDPKTDAWEKIPSAPLEGRTGFMMAWTGQKLLIWGGSQTAGTDHTYFNDGAEYDTATQKWELLPKSPLERRSSMAGVWMGDQLIIWGGYHHGKYKDDGAALKDGKWTPLPSAPMAPRAGVAAAALDGKLVIWGGCGQDVYRDGALFDGKEWKKLRNPTLAGRSLPCFGLNGSKLVIWGGYNLSGPEWSGGSFDLVER
jgi:N-acetylneuraminic acid mutarotase